MKMSKGKTKRILLGLLLCGAVCNTAHAEDYTWADYTGKIVTTDVTDTYYTDAEGNTHEITYKTVDMGSPETKSITVASNAGARIDNSSGTTISINDTFAGLSDTSGGAVYNSGTITAISGSTFSNNTASSYGGAIYNNSTITGIDGSYFLGNTASSYGGAIYNAAGTTIGSITNSYFISNSNTSSSSDGGAIYNGGYATIGSITGSYFASNEAHEGAAIYNNNGTITSIGDSEGASYFVNNKGTNGGAIYNTGTGKIESIENSYFIGNTATTGGAIYATSSSSIGGIRGSYFINNTASSTGGAIYSGSSSSSIGDITGSYFIGNTSSGSGGAIYNYGRTTSIGNITGSYFVGNTSSGSGGAIYLWGTIGNITDSYFAGNSSAANGGALCIDSSSTVGSMEGTSFIGNHVERSGTAHGGAIYNEGTINEGSIVLANLIGNSAQGTTGAQGGAIYDETSTSVTVTGDVADNYVKTTSGNVTGGVIYLEQAFSGAETAVTVNGSVTGNHAVTESGTASGGAFYNNANSTLSIGGDISGNYAQGTTGAYGGAIYNAGTLTIAEGVTISGNYAQSTTGQGTEDLAAGGAIYNSGTITSITGSAFTENKAGAGDGGAISNRGTITSITGSTFTGNTAGFGGAIFNYQPESASGYGTIESITGSAFTENTADYQGGAIFVGSDSHIGELSGSNFTGNTAGYYGGAIFIDVTDSYIGEISNSTFTENKADFGGAIYNAGSINELSGSTFTENTAGESGGAIYNGFNSGIDIISDSTFEKNAVEASSGDASGGAIYNSGTGGGSGIKEISGSTFTGNYAVSENGNAYGGAIYNEGTGYGIGSINGGTAFSGNYVKTTSGEAKGGAIYNSGTISTFSVQTLSGNYAEGTTSAMGGAIYDEGKSEITIDGDVTGNYATASSGEALGGAIYAGEGTVVTLSGNITGNSATGDTALGGAIYNAGTVNINIENQDAVISGNKTVSGGTEEANVLYGTADSVTNFNLTDATLRLDDSLTGDTGYEVNVKGNGTDSATFYMLNDILDSNLSFDSTTINTINNEVKAYSVNKLSINGNVNFVADVDMANETMDRFTASEYGEHAGKLNVSGMNLISDTEADRVDIYFAEEGLKDSVTSSVGTLPDSKNQQKAYTPLYQYNVAYDNRSDGGYFTFDKAGNNPSADVPEEGEAAAISFMNLMYRYAFEHSDYYMKLPKKVRLAIMKGEEGEAEKEFKNYNGHNLTDPGIWVKPFASNETVPFSHQFTARTKNYGLLVGVDTAFKEKGKWANVFTGYAGYDGIKQTFDGNSTEQYGGVIGVTDTLYKGNFYAALTLSGGENVLKAKTMYGREKTHLYMAGAAVKTGYNLEFAGGNYSFLPTFMASYTYADIKDYTSASGLKMDSDGMHAVELNPNFKFIRNLNNGWMPYVTVGEIWTVGQHSKVKASGTELDELTFRPYTEYGLGVQKMWSKGYDGYAEFLGHAGGRRGFLINLGFRWAFN